MARTRHLTRSAVIATASALFAVAGAGTAALAFNGPGAAPAAGSAVVEIAAAPAPTAAEISAPAKARAASLAQTAAAVRAEREAAAQRAAAAKAAKAAAQRAAAKAAHKAAAQKAAAQKAAAQKAASSRKATTSSARATSSGRPSGRTITLGRYVYAPGSQSAIDKCQLVLWWTKPLWLAAHNYCGYQWLAFVATGTTVVVPSGKAAGTYVVTGHKRLSRQGGSLPSVNADLVLQTCVGSGTGLTLLQRV